MADTPKKGGPKPFDKTLGQKLRALRKQHGLSGKRLADLLGVSLKQLHKYETGVNRTPAGLLVIAARVFQVPTSHFFEGTKGTPPSGHVLDPHILRLDESIVAVEGVMESLRPVAVDLKAIRKDILAKSGQE